MTRKKAGFLSGLMGGGKKQELRSESVSVGDLSAVSAVEQGEDSFTVSLSEGGNPTASGTTVFTGSGGTVANNKTALSLATVYACIDRISSSVAILPFKVMVKDEGEFVEVPNHPVTKAIEIPPNDWMTSFQMKRAFMVDALRGNGYLWIKKNRDGSKILEMIWCPEVSVSLNNISGNRWVYGFTDEYGVYNTIDPDDMVHIRALGNTQRKGLSPIMLHASTIKTGLDMQNYGETFFNGGAKPSGVVGVKTPLDKAGWDRLLKTWEKNSKQAIQSSDNRVMFLPADVSYNAISISPIDAALVQMMKLSREEICGIYNVPGYMVGDLSKVYSGSVEAMLSSFVKNTIRPWSVNIEQELTKKLLSPDDIEKGYSIKADFTELLKGTPQEMLTFFTGAATSGFITRNEGRAGLGYARDKTDPTMDEFTYNVSQSAFAPDSGSDKSGNKDDDTTPDNNDNGDGENKGDKGEGNEE